MAWPTPLLGVPRHPDLGRLRRGLDEAERAIEIARGSDDRMAWLMRGCAGCALERAYREAGLVAGGAA